MLFPAAHTRVANIWEYPPPRTQPNKLCLFCTKIDWWLISKCRQSGVPAFPNVNGTFLESILLEVYFKTIWSALGIIMWTYCKRKWVLQESCCYKVGKFFLSRCGLNILILLAERRFEIWELQGRAKTLLERFKIELFRKQWSTF